MNRWIELDEIQKEGNTAMVGKEQCPKCGLDLPKNAPEGLCPKCLLRMGLESSINPGSSFKIEGPDTIIGRYKLLELVGEGGMGTVYLAEQQEPVHRKVALKIIKLGLDTIQIVARFQAEQQTLAMLDHPNIAQMFDAGTTESGRPYFVMEYVEGVPITKYCDQHKLSIEERLNVFLQVCSAIQHAHQKGVLHRDIKPSNILVCARDVGPILKIIDFGIAKAIAEPAGDWTGLTEQGQLLGTPEYMSPEQADLAYSQIDTRSDVYSLGVVLYELLAGAPPFAGKSLRQGGIEQTRQIIRNEEPKTPSARLTALGDHAKEVAIMRRTQIFALVRRLKSELEWIPLKAMCKKREQRYQSVSDLAQDITNYLAGTALLAGPESRLYRTRKFLRKHAGSVAMVTLVFTAVLLGLVTSILMGCRAERARQQEATARQQVEQALARAEQAERVAQEQRKKSEQLAEDYRKALYFNRIALADVACHNNDVRRTRELLDSCPEDLRGWEWHRLNYISDQSRLTMYGHDGWELGFSPDGKWIAAGGQDNTVKIWDAATGAEVMTLRGHKAQVVTAAFSPDGHRIVSGSRDHTLKIWDVASHKELLTFRGHDGIAGALFSPDGKRIVSGSTDKTVRVWDAQTGEALMTLRGHRWPVICHAVSPDGRRIVSGGRDDAVRVWDIESHSQVMVLRGHQGYVNGVSFSPDGTRIVSGSWDGTIKVWDANTGEELLNIQAHNARIYDVTFDPSGKRIASASNDRTVKLWDSSTGVELMTLRGHKGYVSSVAFSPDGKWIASCSGDGTVKLWDATANHEYMRIPTGGGTWQGVSFSPDGNRVLSGSRDPGGWVRVWDRWTGAELMTLRGSENDTIACAKFSPDGKRIFGGQIRRGTIWDVSTGEQLMSLSAEKGYLLATFSPDSKYLATWEADWSGEPHDNTITIRKKRTGAALMTLKGHEAEVQAVAFSPDGRRVVSGDLDGTINQWSMETGEKLRAWRHEGGVLTMALSPDGGRLVTGGTAAEPTVEVWDAETGTRILTLHGHSAEIWSVAFSPDGKRIVSGSKDRTVRIWDAASGTELLTIRQPRRQDGWTLPAARFSPDGKTLGIGGFGGVMLLKSEVPADGFKAWRTGAAARELVNELYTKQGRYAKVIEQLKANETLGERLRQVALQIATARLPENGNSETQKE